jgi:hypothetical protein
LPKEPRPQFIPSGKTFVGRGEGRQGAEPDEHVALICAAFKDGSEQRKRLETENEYNDASSKN